MFMVRVFGGVAVLRRVAASNVAAIRTHSEMHPGVAQLYAIFADMLGGPSDLKMTQMGAFWRCAHPFLPGMHRLRCRHKGGRFKPGDGHVGRMAAVPVVSDHGSPRGQYGCSGPQGYCALATPITMARRHRERRKPAVKRARSSAKSCPASRASLSRSVCSPNWWCAAIPGRTRASVGCTSLLGGGSHKCRPMPRRAAGSTRRREWPMLRHMPHGLNSERRVKLFRNGRNQAVRIPREFELPGEEAVLRKEGQRLVLEPSPRKSLLTVLSELEPLRENFPPIRDLPPDPVEL